MKKLYSKITLAVTLSASLLTACATNDANRISVSNASTGNGNSPAPAVNHNGAVTSDDVPPSVRAAFPAAQTIQTEHRTITPAQVAEIERETETRITERDHHTYLAFAMREGVRRQIGAATVFTANGKEFVIVYESRNGIPYIQEVRAEGIAAAFLEQFRGKGHDDPLRIGADLRANGVDEATARAAADAIRRDTRIMQTLYGAAHTH